MTSLARIVIGVFLIAHGIAHVVGFAVPWKLVEAADVPYRTTLLGGTLDVGETGIKGIGLVWLALGVAVASLGVGLLANRFSYQSALWIIGASLLLSIAGWPDTRIGVALNAVLLVAVALLCA